jgi:hypothetical protein
VSDEPDSGWRYQPVFQQDEEDATFSLCIVAIKDG